MFVVGRWCSTASGAAAPPYRDRVLLVGRRCCAARFEGDIYGRAVVLHRQRSSSSALPDRVLLVGRRCPAAKFEGDICGRAVVPRRQV
jgi:hypothetical protein